jgi:deoxyhypusine synthase
VPTETVPDTAIIKGHDFSKGSDLDSIMSAMITSGFQATALGQAIEEVNRMVSSKGQMNTHMQAHALYRLLAGQEISRRDCSSCSVML